MSSKHTPGPWDMVVPADGLWPPRIFSGSKFIGMINNSDDKQEQRVTDARLIAAAPDMLEALRVLDASLAMHGFDTDGTMRSTALAAIAKAEGHE